MVVEIVVAIIGTLLATLIGNELCARAPAAADKLLERAIAKLPRRYRERFREEWAADLLAQPTLASRLTFAFGFNIAARKILFVERHRVAIARAESRRRFATANGSEAPIGSSGAGWLLFASGSLERFREMMERLRAILKIMWFMPRDHPELFMHTVRQGFDVGLSTAAVGIVGYILWGAFS